MPKFKKKSVIIDAVQWTGNNLLEVIKHTGQNATAKDYKWEDYEDLVKKDGLKIFTLEGTMKANIGDWIIKGVQGECYPCELDIFIATYDAVLEGNR